MGGIGKTVVARALCDDKTVQAAFPDGILWATLGKDVTQADIIDKLRDWIANLGGGTSEKAPTLESLKVSFARLLENRRCLLIVDNVWKKGDVEAFRVGGEKSCLLLTTRDANIAKLIGAEIHTIPVMTENEAVDLLEQWMHEAVRDTNYATKVKIVELLGRLPLAIKLAGAQMIDNSPESWLSQFQQLRDLDVEYETDDPEKSVYICFKMSIEALSPQVRDLYYSLCIFRQDEAIPEEAIHTLWNHLANLRSQAIRQILNELSNKALLSSQQREGLAITIHDLLRKYIDAETEAVRGKLHQNLLDAYRQACAGEGWHTAPKNATYLFDHLVYHLHATHNYSEIKALFRSPDC